MVGLPGAGKSTFSKLLCRRIGAQRVNGDLAKAKIFGSVDKANYEGDGKRDDRHRQAYKKVHAEAESILKQSRHLVRDYQHNGFATRAGAHKLALAHDAYHVVAWLEIDPEVSTARALARAQKPSGPDIPIWDQDRAVKATAKCLAKRDPARNDENIIWVDATISPDSQVDLFLEQIGWPGY